MGLGRLQHAVGWMQCWVDAVWDGCSVGTDAICSKAVVAAETTVGSLVETLQKQGEQSLGAEEVRAGCEALLLLTLVLFLGQDQGPACCNE